MRPITAQPTTNNEAIEDKIAAKQKRLKKICAQIEVDTPSGPFAAKEIARAVCKAHEITFDEMMGPSRKKPIVIARHHAMWEVRRHTNLSTTAIGFIFGRRDHTTVIAACRRHELRRVER